MARSRLTRRNRQPLTRTLGKKIRNVSSAGLLLRTRIQTEVAFQAAVPGFVVTCVQVHPLFVRLIPPPLQEGSCVGSHRVAKLPCPALDDFQDLLSNQR